MKWAAMQRQRAATGCPATITAQSLAGWVAPPALDGAALGGADPPPRLLRQLGSTVHAGTPAPRRPTAAPCAPQPFPHFNSVHHADQGRSVPQVRMPAEVALPTGVLTVVFKKSFEFSVHSLLCLSIQVPIATVLEFSSVT